MMNILKFAAIIFTILIFLIKCTDDGPDLGKYYEKSFADSITTILNTDTVKIIIEQFGVSNQVQEYIPYDTINNLSLLDTIRLVLNVNFGSYSPNPDPFKDIIISNDTLYIWYASKQKPGSERLFKPATNNSISGIQTSPKLEYYNIENVHIKKSPSKKIIFESKLYQ